MVSGMKSQTRIVPITFRPASARVRGKPGELERSASKKLELTPGESTLRSESSEKTGERQGENEVAVE